MGEEDKVTEVAATVSNGTVSDADKLVGTATENKVDGKDGISEIEKDGKDDTNVEKMDIDEPKVKQSKESKSNGEQEQEEKDGNKEQEKEDPKNEAEEKSEAQADEGKGDVVDEKLEASKEERDQQEEEKEGEVEEDDKVIEVAATVSNGTALDVDKLIETATENKVDGKDGISEIEKDAEDDNIEKMDIDEPEIKQSKESKNNGEQEQEEKDENEEQEKENPKIEAKEEKSEAQAGKGNDGLVDEKLDASKDEKDQQEEENEGEVDKERKKEDSTKKNARAKGTGKKDNKKEVRKEKEEPKTPLVSSTDRPVRERKSVERLVASTEKETARKFHIEKGRGTALKDIPNVAYKLSKKKTDETCKTLHTILFGRRGKAAQIRSNISRFSGFVWHENEEKQRLKVKEKFDKCVKEKLLDFCDVLDVPIARSTTKKEDIVTKLIDFLLAPHVTDTESLAEMEQSSKGKKRKRVSKESGSTSGTPLKGSAKSQKSGNATKAERKNVKAPKQDDSEEEDEEEEREEEEEHKEENMNGVPESSDDEMPEHDEGEKKGNESEDESEEERERQKPSSNKSSAKESSEKVRMKKDTTPMKSSPKPKKTPTKFQSRRLKVNNNSDLSPKMLSGKKKDEIIPKKKSSNPEKAATKEKNGRRVVKGKDNPKEEKVKLRDEDLQNAIREILKEVDFNTATFTDILKQLAKQFNTDLTPRKSSIKLMIQDELTKLADEAEDDEDEIDTENDGKPPSGQGVEA